MKRNLYFDNASTSFPKPEALEAAAISYLRRGGNYGRASYHRAVENVRVVEQCRDAIGRLLGVSGDTIAFTKNATEAANAVLSVLNLSGRVVYVSPLEHNAVMRVLVSQQADIKVLPHGADGRVCVDKFKNIDWSQVALVCVNHASNVNGVVQPLTEIADVINGVPLFVDASQSIGVIDDIALAADYLVFTGHKGLYGTTGTGGFYCRKPEQLRPFLYGGTGSNSESYDMPDFTPDKFEAGTLNIMGIEMLFAAVNNKPQSQHSRADFRALLYAVRAIEGVVLYAAEDFEFQTEVFSIRCENIGVSQLSDRLYYEFGVEIRKGLHCAPLAHRSLGTFAEGTVRFSLSAYHSTDDLNYLLEAIKTVCKNG